MFLFMSVARGSTRVIFQLSDFFLREIFLSSVRLVQVLQSLIYGCQLIDVAGCQCMKAFHSLVRCELTQNSHKNLYCTVSFTQFKTLIDFEKQREQEVLNSAHTFYNFTLCDVHCFITALS